MNQSRGRGTRYPSAERTRLLKAAHRHRAEGWSWARIGAALGLPGETLRWWSQRDTRADDRPARKVGSMVPITIVPATERSEATLTLVAPSGWRIEGLSVAVALDVLRRLGC